MVGLHPDKLKISKEVKNEFNILKLLIIITLPSRHVANEMSSAGGGLGAVHGKDQDPVCRTELGLKRRARVP